MYIHVRTKVKLRIGWKITWLALLAAVFVVAQIATFEDLRTKGLRVASILVSVCVYAFIFFKSRLIPLLRDKHWVGTVQGRTTRKSTVVRGVVAHRGNTEDVIIAKWCIVREDGTDNLLEYETGVIADDYFKPGDKVRHYKGAKLIVKADPPPHDENLLCPLCGKMVMRPRCSFCKVRFDTP